MASVREFCHLLRNFLVVETKFMKGLKEHGQSCGAPPDLLKRVKAHHKKASQTGREFCEWPPGDYLRPDELQRLRGPR